MSQQAKRQKEKDDLQKELSMYEEDGIFLKLNGDLSNARSIAEACLVAENGSYMRDYIENEKGEWIGLGFDWILEK